MASEERRRQAQGLCHLLGIALYLLPDGRIVQRPPAGAAAERIAPPPFQVSPHGAVNVTGAQV